MDKLKLAGEIVIKWTILVLFFLSFVGFYPEGWNGTIMGLGFIWSFMFAVHSLQPISQGRLEIYWFLGFFAVKGRPWVKLFAVKVASMGEYNTHPAHLTFSHPKLNSAHADVKFIRYVESSPKPRRDWTVSDFITQVGGFTEEILAKVVATLVGLAAFVATPFFLEGMDAMMIVSLQIVAIIISALVMYCVFVMVGLVLQVKDLHAGLYAVLFLSCIGLGWGLLELANAYSSVGLFFLIIALQGLVYQVSGPVEESRHVVGRYLFAEKMQEDLQILINRILEAETFESEAGRLLMEQNEQYDLNFVKEYLLFTQLVELMSFPYLKKEGYDLKIVKAGANFEESASIVNLQPLR